MDFDTPPVKTPIHYIFALFPNSVADHCGEIARIASVSFRGCQQV